MIAPIIIINGPTGVGKTAVIKKLFHRIPQLRSTITYSTRPPRHNAREDKKMIYVSPSQFKVHVDKGDILEWARYDGHLYGTAKKSVALANGNPLLFNIEIKGTRRIKKLYPQCLTIFIRPDSMSQIKERLQKRRLEPHEFRRRYREAGVAMKNAHFYDYQVTNHQGKISQTVTQIERLIRTYLKSSQLEPIIDKKTKKR